MEYKIKKITSVQAKILIDDRKPIGLFYTKEENKFIGIDNSTGDAFTEEFTTKDNCFKWLKNDGKTTIRKLRKGIYKHFMGGKYEVLGEAQTENNTTLVVHRALYGQYNLCVTPVDAFLAEVNKEKYPDITQKYKYELIKEID